jgi:acetyl esterase
VVAGFDPLRDEVEAYGAKLQQQGVKVDTLRYSGMIHGFFAMPGVFDQTHHAIEQSAARLRAAIA